MTLRILVDECVQRPISRAFEAAGHDLRFVGAGHAGLDDRQVAALAIADDRIVLTHDYDFGDLVVRHGLGVPGVILVSCEALPPSQRGAHVLTSLADLMDKLAGALTIVEPRRVRQRRLR